MLTPKGTPVVCRSGECQGLLFHQTRMAPEAFQTHFKRQGKLIRDRHAREAQRQAHIKAVDEAEAEGNQRITEEVKRTRDDGERLLSVALPRGLDAPAVDALERRERFRAHLEAVISAAEALTGTEEIPEERYKGARERNVRVTKLLDRQPGLQERYDQLCGMCRGGCCTTGEEHAYLTTYTVRRLLDADPSLTAAALLKTYTEHIPEKSMENACLLQTSSGCALPRELRSDVCNGYFCPQLLSIQEHWSEENPPPVLAIQRAHHIWNRYITTTTNPVTAVAVMDEGGVHDLKDS